MFVVLLVEDAEYMIMSCPSSSPSNEQIDTPGTGNAELQTQDVKQKINVQKVEHV